MILNTGMRTDIPAYFPEWFMNRIREGYVLTRNPYNAAQVTRYRLDPSVVDLLVFGTKNPASLLPYLKELMKFRMYWFVTVNPYGKEIEPNVPHWRDTFESIRILSENLGKKNVIWRIAPIIVNDQFTVEWHIERFRVMAPVIAGQVESCMIAFLDRYDKTKRNFPEGRTVRREEKAAIGKAFKEIADKNGIRLIGCYEDQDLAEFGIDVSGCMTHNALEHIGDFHLTIPKSATSGMPKVLGSSASLTEKQAKEYQAEHGCILGNDIGVYNTCPHGCKYCYANYDPKVVADNIRHHDINSPYLVGGPIQGEVIHDANQVSWIDPQMSILDLL